MDQTPSQEKPDLSDNPYLKIEDPWAGHKAQQAQINEKAKEFGRLCHAVFHNSVEGKALWEFLKEQYVMQQNLDPTHPQASNTALWWDGFKSAILGMYNAGLLHVKRANVGAN